MIQCLIFDLDGVIVDTARYHYQAWAALACELGFEFSEAAAEATKGVSRMTSLEIMLAAGGHSDRFSEAEKLRMANKKNRDYLSHVAQMGHNDVLPGVSQFLTDARKYGLKIALGSSSKNAQSIIRQCGLEQLFDGIADGTNTTEAKPNPEIFLLAAKLVGISPAQCVVFEDAASGIEAARRAKMLSVGVGCNDSLASADLHIKSFEGLTFERFMQSIPFC